MRAVFTALLLPVLFVTVAASSASAAEVVDRIIAVVNDDIILKSELDTSSAPFIARATANVANVAAKAEAQAQVRKQVLESLISEALVNQEARALGIVVTEREVEADIDGIKKREGISQEQMLQQLARQGMTLARLKEDLRGQRKRLKLIEFKVKPRVSVSDDELREYYNNNFKTDDVIEVSMITFRIPPAATEDETDAIFATAKKARKTIVGGDKSFADVAKEQSEGVNAKGGGVLGKFRRGEMNAAFEQAAFELKQGEVSEPIKAAGGVHLLFVSSREEKAAKTFDDVKPRAYNILFQQKAEREYVHWVAELREKGFVDVRLEGRLTP